MSTIGKPIQCKAAVCWNKNEPLVIETVSVATPKDNEIRYKMVATGICSSDLGIQSGESSLTPFPLIAGHETTAIVESVGSNVKSVAIGDAIIPLWAPHCGQCNSCVTGTRNLCDDFITHSAVGKLTDGTCRITCKGQEIRQPVLVAGFSEYSVIPDNSFVKLPEGAPLDKLCLYGCCMPTGYGAAKLTAKVRPGSTVVIYGLGSVGLCVTLGCRDSGASKIIGVDICQDKAGIGKDFGCTDFINPSQHLDKNTATLVKELTNGIGVDYAFVCVGKSSIIEDAFAACRFNCGETIIVGVAPLTETIKISPLEMFFGKSIKASLMGDCKAKDVLNYVKMYLDGALKTDALITHVLPLERINEGFDLLKSTKSIRAVIKF